MFCAEILLPPSLSLSLSLSLSTHTIELPTLRFLTNQQQYGSHVGKQTIKSPGTTTTTDPGERRRLLGKQTQRRSGSQQQRRIDYAVDMALLLQRDTKWQSDVANNE